jgi:hypothetical protein
MSRALAAVEVNGSTSSCWLAQRRARSLANPTTRSKLRREAPAERGIQLLGQSQSSGVLRPVKRGSMPIRSNRAPVSPMAWRASTTLASTGIAGPPRLMNRGPIRCAGSVASSREMATVIVRRSCAGPDGCSPVAPRPRRTALRPGPAPGRRCPGALAGSGATRPAGGPSGPARCRWSRRRRPVPPTAPRLPPGPRRRRRRPSTSRSAWPVTGRPEVQAGGLEVVGRPEEGQRR